MVLSVLQETVARIWRGTIGDRFSYYRSRKSEGILESVVKVAGVTPVFQHLWRERGGAQKKIQTISALSIYMRVEQSLLSPKLSYMTSLLIGRSLWHIAIAFLLGGSHAKSSALAINHRRVSSVFLYKYPRLARLNASTNLLIAPSCLSYRVSVVCWSHAV